jgi:sialate O-acetylesterase
VLQRDVAVPVWGTCDSAEPITVSFAGQQVSAQPSEGKWRTELAPLEACSDPRSMIIVQGTTQRELKNLLVGDVWVCSGQSNMYVPVRDTDGGRAAIDTAKNQQLRLYFIDPFPVDREHPQLPQDFVDGQWKESSPDAVEGFTAVGYYFGRSLQKEIRVPIGLIESTLGGTTAERWTSRESMELDPYLKDSTESLKHDLYNGLIAPLTQFPIRGVIWYQGESNAPRSWHYRTLLPAMIKCWRNAWGIGDFPFLIVQLPGFEKIKSEPSESDWADMREAQLYVSQTIQNVGLVVSIDLGDEHEIHPRKKQPIGERLTLSALAIAYGRKILHSGPIYNGMTVRGQEVVLNFEHVGQGLEARDGPLRGFTIAGEDRIFYNASARIEADKVIVWSDVVPEPKAVRYGWAKNPVVNLWNKDGLPASPFRTDDFPLPTRENK